VKPGRRLKAGLRSVLPAAALAILLCATLPPARSYPHDHPHERAQDGAPDGEESAPFDYFVLALSWSPTYCAAHPSDHAECRLGRGFVAHGLWPQYARGGGPEHCGGADTIDPATVKRALAAMPDEHLVRHEWVVHGTCTGMSAHDYFLSMIKAVGALEIPAELDGNKDRTLTADQIAAQFLRANPAFGPRSVVVRCKGEQFEELRVCLSPDLLPVSCGRGVHTQCRRSQALRIRAAR
jgi:ribonuclease T2